MLKYALGQWSRLGGGQGLQVGQSDGVREGHVGVKAQGLEDDGFEAVEDGSFGLVSPFG